MEIAPPVGKTVAFISASGGVGKTKLALMLAWYLRKHGKRVLIIDLDPTAGISLELLSEEQYERCVDEGKTLSDFLRERIVSGRNVDLRDYTSRAEIYGYSVSIVPAGEFLLDMMDQLWRGGAPGPRLMRLIYGSIPRDSFDVLIVDTAPFFDPRYTSAAIYLANLCFIPLKPSVLDFRRTLRMLRRIRDDLENAGTEVRLIFNFVPTGRLVYERVFVDGVVRGASLEDIKRGRSKDAARRIESLYRAFDALVSFCSSILRVSDPLIRGYVPYSPKIHRFPSREVSESDITKMIGSLLTTLLTLVSPGVR